MKILDTKATQNPFRYKHQWICIHWCKDIVEIICSDKFFKWEFSPKGFVASSCKGILVFGDRWKFQWSSRKDTPWFCLPSYCYLQLSLSVFLVPDEIITAIKCPSFSSREHLIKFLEQVWVIRIHLCESWSVQVRWTVKNSLGLQPFPKGGTQLIF